MNKNPNTSKHIIISFYFYNKGDDNVIEKFAWDHFEKTGDVTAFLNYKDIEKNRNVSSIKKTKNITVNDF